MSSINVDGNFELEHMNMKHPEADISLSNGEAFMVESSNYHYHLGIGGDKTEVCPILFTQGGSDLTFYYAEINLQQPQSCQPAE